MKRTSPLLLISGSRQALSTICAVIAILMSEASSHAACILINSSSVSVAGQAGGNIYAGENSGGSIGETADGSIWRADSSGSMTTSGANLSSDCRLIGGSGLIFENFGSSSVTLISVFQPLLRELTFEFSGSAGDHYFESYIDYSLKDLTTNTLIENLRWAREVTWVDGQSLPYTANYMLDIAHEYQLIINAQSRIGDGRQGYANIQMNIIPEIPCNSLVALGISIMTIRRNRKMP